MEDKPSGISPDPPPYEQINPVLLETICAHEEWVATQKISGRLGDLSKADLSCCDLRGRVLSGADLSGAQFNDADLSEACLNSCNLDGAIFDRAKCVGTDFSGACLASASLRGADLTRASLASTDLTKADLTSAVIDRTLFGGAAGLGDVFRSKVDLAKARGFLASDLSGRDLTGVNLPEEVMKFKDLDQATEICKSAQPILLAFLGACAYCVLAIAGTRDISFLLDTSSITLPIVQTQVSTAGFYLAMPVLLLIIAIYFHLYLQRLWEALSRLPAILPDGRRLDQATYPWLLNGLLPVYHPMLTQDRPVFWRAQMVIALLAAWLSLPAIISAFWLRYLARHDVRASLFHATLLAIAWACVVLSLQTARNTLGKEESTQASTGVPLRSTIRIGLILVCCTVVFVGVTFAGMRGKRVWSYQQWSWALAALMPQALTSIGLPPFLDIRGAEVSVPGKSANLRGRDLSQSDASGATFANADITEARFDGASLFSSNFSGVSAWNSSFAGGMLFRTNLRSAALVGADLRDADLSATDLSRATLEGARLQRANLSCHRFEETPPECAHVNSTRLVRANLADAILEGADLRDSDLTAASLRGANLAGTDLTSVKFGCFHLGGKG